MAKVALPEHHDIVKAPPPDRADEPLRMPAAGRDARSANRRAAGTRSSGPRTDPSTRCRQHDYEERSSSLGTAVASLSTPQLPPEIDDLVQLISAPAEDTWNGVPLANLIRLADDRESGDVVA